jgi:hypothetical protein
MFTRIPGVPDSSTIVRGMAHFAGTGPAGTICRDCVYWDFYLKDHWASGGHAAAACHMQKKLSQQKGPVPLVPAGTPSCKYFEPRPKRQ